MKKTAVIIICVCLIPLLISCGKSERVLSFASSDAKTKEIYAYLCSIEKKSCLSAQQEST